MKKYLTSIIAATAAAAAMGVTRDEALAFLYSSMSLPDRADYTSQFYAANVDASLRARAELPWGDSVPDREWLHFVLPVRVNNENLDDSRMVFYEELKPRVEHLSMKDAILEVNHWCHEKVTYKPSDGRTSSPLSIVSQAIGRCGEESTFTVAALRALGIPARQIYTPRWAHTDDNHAWVEAWADGRWYFLGACEPEPVLNLAWFNDPASRGMLMNTNVAGDYRGPEEVLLKQPLSTRINVTENYAPVATLPVRVLNADGTPAADANADFCIYNYAEYYPAVSKKTDRNGMASLTAGLGDVVVWASDGKRFGIAKASPKDFADGGTLEVVLDKDGSYTGSFDLDINPPRPGSSAPAVTPVQREHNDMRMHMEDSIRNTYMLTFATPASARQTARDLSLDGDEMVKILTEARGNHKNISDFLRTLTPGMREKAVTLLLNVSEKDRRDIEMAVVADNIGNSTMPSGMDGETYGKYVLNPRIEVEYLRPWRGALRERFSAEADEFRANPQKLAKWTAENIADGSEENPSNLRMSPLAVLASGRADPTSRNIFFVAAARSLDIPARIDPVTGVTQYMNNNNNWIDADFGAKAEPTDKSAKGKLIVKFCPEGNIANPRYYSQFSISRIENGRPHLLEFDEDGTVTSIFPEPYTLDAGQYILTTGQRLANGGVLAHSEIFVVKPDETTEIPLSIRHDDSQLSVIGSLNAENLYHNIESGTDKSLLSTTGRGYYVLGLIQPNHEPSAHALNDISKVAEELEADGKKIMLLFDDKGKADRFRKEAFANLPANVVFGIDTDGTTRREITESLNLDNPGDPIFVVADTFNRIVWVSTGYAIGLGEQLLRLNL